MDSSKVTPPKPKAPHFDKEAFYTDLSGRIIGQPQPLRALTEHLAVHVCKTAPTRPIVVLLAGPTGVGKTQTAKETAKRLSKYTGTDYDFIRVDMNQLSEKHDVSKLKGTTAGYIGYDDPLFFEPLMKNKYAVILLDEMEKGHPAALQVLMNVFSEGRLETAKPIEGQNEFDLRYTVILATSNLPLSVKDPDGMTQREITRECRAQLTRPIGGKPAMPPELASRFTEILLFRELSDTDKVDILGISLIESAKQYGITVKSIDPAFLQDVVNDLTVSNGARDAIGEIERMLGEPLAAFNREHEGITEVALSGTCEAVIVEPYAG